MRQLTRQPKGEVLIKFKSYFLAPKLLFFSLSWLPWHFLQRSADIGFFPPHLKHILKKSLLCCAICFFVASMIGIAILVSLHYIICSFLLTHNSKLFVIQCGARNIMLPMLLLWHRSIRGTLYSALNVFVNISMESIIYPFSQVRSLFENCELQNEQLWVYDE
jgi:hypothetical protein